MESDLPPSSTPRKVKFAPKGPANRKKPLPPKREVAGDGDNGEDEEINEALLRKVNDHLTRRRPQAEKKSSVQVVFTQGVASSSLTTSAVAKEGSRNKSGDIGSRDYAANTSQDTLSLPPRTSTDSIAENSQNATGSLFKQKKKAYKEPWDYNHSYYPITLPLRRPYSGDPEVLDQEEFGEIGAVSDYDENAVHPASALGLMEEDVGVKMLVLQLPADLPLGQRPASAAGKKASGLFELAGHPSTGLDSNERAGGTAGSSKAKEKEIRSNTSTVSGSAKGKETVDNSMSSVGTNFSKELRSSELAAGHMGKLLVYKSGAVKLKLGDVLYDVFPGMNFSAQNVVAINAWDRDCCLLGEAKRGVVMPAIDSLVPDPVINL